MDVVRIKRRWRVMWTIAAAVTVAAAAGVVSVPPPAGAITGWPINLLNRLDYQCLDILGFDYTDGATIGQWWCNGAKNQEWFIDNGGPNEVGWDYWMIKSNWDNKCMDVAGANYSAGNQVVQYACHGGHNQRFVLQIIDHSGAGWNVVNIHPMDAPGMCLDVLGHNDEYGAPLGIWPCNGAWNQMFITEEV
jgi:hypothetical protein